MASKSPLLIVSLVASALVCACASNPWKVTEDGVPVTKDEALVVLKLKVTSVTPLPILGLTNSGMPELDVCRFGGSEGLDFEEIYPSRKTNFVTGQVEEWAWKDTGHGVEFDEYYLLKLPKGEYYFERACVLVREGRQEDFLGTTTTTTTYLSFPLRTAFNVKESGAYDLGTITVNIKEIKEARGGYSTQSESFLDQSTDSLRDCAQFYSSHYASLAAQYGSPLPVDSAHFKHVDWFGSDKASWESLWPHGRESEFACWKGSGLYHLEKSVDNASFYFTGMATQISTDPYYDVEWTGRMTLGGPDTSYGLMVGYDAKNCYYLDTSEAGLACVREIRKGKWQPMIVDYSGKVAKSRAEDAMNQYKLEVRGRNLTYLVNGSKIAEFQTDYEMSVPYLSFFLDAKEAEFGRVTITGRPETR